MTTPAALLLAAALGFGPYAATPVRVIDGDTVVLDLAIAPGLTQRAHVRLDAVNTPELHRGDDCERQAGARARDYVVRRIAQARQITVRNVRRGKYAGRVLGQVLLDDVDLGAELVDNGLARPYHGERRAPWCG